MIFNRLLFFIISAIRPLLGPSACYYKETCTIFAGRQLEEKNVVSALYTIIKRILSCNPLSYYILTKYYSVLLILLISATPCLIHAKSFFSPLYKAINCNQERIRDALCVETFLKKLLIFLSIDCLSEPIIKLSDNGYTCTYMLAQGGAVNMTIINKNNAVFVHLFSIQSPANINKITTFIEQYFHAELVIAVDLTMKKLTTSFQ